MKINLCYHPTFHFSRVHVCTRLNRKVPRVRSHNKKASSSWTVWVLISNRAVKGRVNNLTVPVKLLALKKYTLEIPIRRKVFLLILYIVFNRLNDSNGRNYKLTCLRKSCFAVTYVLRGTLEKSRYTGIQRELLAQSCDRGS